MAIKTDLTIQAKVKGFAEAQRGLSSLSKENQKIFRDQIKGAKSSDKSLKEMKKSLKGLTEVQTGLLKALSKSGEIGSKSYKNIQSSLKATERDASRLVRVIGNMEKAFGKAKGGASGLEKTLGKGGFTQGLIQGGMPGGAGMFLQRGPGMKRQVAGMAAGRFARGVAGTPFGGIQALASGLGPLGAPLMNAASQSGKALQFQQQMMTQAPFLGGVSGMIGRAGRGAAQEDVGAAGQAALSGARATVTPGMVKQNLDPEQLRLHTRTVRNRMLKNANIPEGIMGRAQRRIIDTEAAQVAKRELGKVETGILLGDKGAGSARTMGEAAATERNAKARGAARGAARGGAFSALTQGGRKFGAMERMQSIQFGGQLGKAGALGLGGITPGIMGGAVAAQTRYGVGADVSGQFLRSKERGGLSGATGIQGLAEGIKDAFELGLTAQEVPDHLQIIAEGISDFKNSGIPFNKEAMQAFKAGGANIGLGKDRGGAIGQQLFQSMGQLAKGGPQSGFDMMTLMGAGGLTDMSQKGQLEARARLTEGGAPEKVFGMIQNMFKERGGEKGGGLGVLQSYLQSRGIQASPQDLLKMSAKMESGTLTAKELVTPVNKGTTLGPGSPKEMRDQAAEYITTMGPNLARQSVIADKQLATGERMLGAVQDLELVQAKLTDEFSKIASGPLTTLTEGIASLASKLPIVVDGISKLADTFGGDKGNWVNKLPGL